MPNIRQSAVAGQFYPNEPDELSAVVKNYIDQAPVYHTRVPKALIAPHAGLAYSGAIAASAYKHLEPSRRTINRVVLLGPCHRVALHGIALSDANMFATPLGKIPIDKKTFFQLEQMQQVSILNEPHRLEHSLEAHLPFLQTMLDSFTLVPLVVGVTPAETVADVLEAIWGGSETLIVISSDLSHYLDYKSARRMDRATCKAIENLDPENIEKNGACGRYPIRGLLTLAKRRNLDVHTVDLRNSGDTAGHKARVVGYGAWLFFTPKEELKKKCNPHFKSIQKSKHFEILTTADSVRMSKAPISKFISASSKKFANKPLLTRKHIKTGWTTVPLIDHKEEIDFGLETRELLNLHGSTLISIAVASIDFGFDHEEGGPIQLDEAPRALHCMGACFVTITQCGRLRGCIGTANAYRPLAHDVSDNAYKAAFKDPRFAALQITERKTLDLSIAVLSPQTPIQFENEVDLTTQLRPGQDGLVIADGLQRALFLPSVWDQLVDPSSFLKNLKKKAGMGTNHWSENFQAWRFVTESVDMNGFVKN
ncbi:MAG: hypothetical protein CBB68_07660 [Rhodospirillaceae bacterium TMED8]|nr:extradiol dioxygenase [Magnetovibrio sp.]OUT50858.1 MAG: hypothetical protein CBB68_07660 [Rhodospirillaceae bacterium TMED8]